MSRTDSTDPALVQIWYSSRKTLVHDHRTGSCDAPLSLDEALVRPDAHCRWELAPLPRGVCLCGHNHRSWWNWLDRTDSRRTAKARLGDARRIVNAGFDAVDLDDVSRDAAGEVGAISRPRRRFGLATARPAECPTACSGTGGARCPAG